MKKAIITLMLLCGCAHWTPTLKAQLRRQAESSLRSCVTFNGCQFTKQCIQESIAWCVEHEMEKTCGTDGIFTNPIVCSRAVLPSELSELYELSSN